MRLCFLASGALCAALAAAAPTPAEIAIARTAGIVAKDPSRPEAHSALAMAYARRARETADTAYYDKAGEAIDKALALAPNHFEAMKARTWVLLGKHDFAKAREMARELNKRAPDDLTVHGLLTDAYVELGDYGAAEASAQRMLDLRPGNLAGLTRAAYLRELFGDLDGAIELMTQAFTRTRPEESEDRAWLLTQIAHLNLVKGSAAAAERGAREALKLFPDYHYALAQLAKARAAQGDAAGAAALFEKRYEVAPHPENLYDVAAAWKKAGRSARSRELFRKFEAAARQEMNGVDNANRELILYYTDHAKSPAKALAIAQRELERRQDVFTRDAYAWALFHTGKRAEAVAQIEQALQVGTRDPGILQHAAAIRGTRGAKIAGVSRARERAAR